MVRAAGVDGQQCNFDVDVEIAGVLACEREAGAEWFACRFHEFGTPETIRLFAEADAG